MMKDSELRKHLAPSLYRILCLDRNSSQELIKETYRSMNKKFHPDVSKEDKQVAHETTVMRNFAYQVLSNQDYKLRYDKILDEYEIAKAELNKKKEIKINSNNFKQPFFKIKPRVSKDVGW